MDSLLKEHKIDSIFCCGLAYDICVGETALSGAKLGYETFLIADASKDRFAYRSSRRSLRLETYDRDTKAIMGKKRTIHRFDPGTV